jgi:GNAT superfamily N-acetyltransferase
MMAKRKKGPPAVPLTRQRLIEGLPGPAGTRIRTTRPEESAQFGDLLTAATDGIEQAHLEAVAAGKCGRWLLEGLASGERALTELLVRADLGSRLQDAALAMSLPLVVQDDGGDLVGALLALPPGQLVQSVREAGYQQHAMLAMLKYAKIKAVAVTEQARGQGLGAALLKRCGQVYWALDFMLLYGEFATERELGPYYRKQGFDVLDPGQTTDVGYVLTGRPIGLGAGPGEQLFYRWNRKQ